MPDTLTLRPRSVAMAVTWVALLGLVGLTFFVTVGAATALADDIGVASFFAVLAALLGWCGWNLCGHILAFQQTRATFRGYQMTVVRVRASTGQWPQFETCTVDLGRCVRIDYRHYLTQGMKGVPSTHACTWIEDDQGNSTVLASGENARATFAKKIAYEITRRTGLTLSCDRNFCFVGMFGGAIPAVLRSFEPAPDLKTWFLRLPGILFGSD